MSEVKNQTPKPSDDYKDPPSTQINHMRSTQNSFLPREIQTAKANNRNTIVAPSSINTASKMDMTTTPEKLGKTGFSITKRQ